MTAGSDRDTSYSAGIGHSVITVRAAVDKLQNLHILKDKKYPESWVMIDTE